MKCKMLLVVQFFVHFIDAFHFEVKNENEMRISFCEMKCKNEMQPRATNQNAENDCFLSR